MLIAVIFMKLNKNPLNYLAAVLIVILFIISLLFPDAKTIVKLAVLLVYAAVSIWQLSKLKKQGEAFEKPLLFSICVLLLIAYLLFL